MVPGPFVRILVQVATIAGGSVLRAVGKAYKDAAKRGPPATAVRTLRAQMSNEEAVKLFGLPECPSSYTKDDIIKRHDRLYQLNAPSGNFPGSPYLQKKISIAQQILLSDFERHNQQKNSSDTTQ